MVYIGNDGVYKDLHLCCVLCTVDVLHVSQETAAENQFHSYAVIKLAI